MVRVLMVSVVVCLISLHAGAGLGADTWDYYMNPGTVNDIVWHEGTVWCATDAGLCEWDIAECTYVMHTANNGLPHNTVTSVDVAADGAIWAGTLGGAVKYEDSTWQSFTTTDELPNDSVHTIATGPADTVWAGTYVSGNMGFGALGAGIAVYNGDSWESLKHDTYDVIMKIVTDSSGMPFMLGATSSLERVILTFDGIDWTVMEGPEGNILKDIVLDGEDRVWILASHTEPHPSVPGFEILVNRVFRRDGDMWTPVASPFDGEVGPQALAADTVGDVWCAASGGGLATLSGDTPALIVENGDTAWLTEFTVDDEWTVWAGTSTGGIARYAGIEWIIADIEIYVLEYVHSLAYDRTRTLCASSPAGLFGFEDDAWISISTLDALPITNPEDSWDITVDQDNRVWTVNAHCLYSFDVTGWATHYLDGNVSSVCTGAIPGSDGFLWTGWNMDGSLYRYDVATSTAEAFPTGSSGPVSPVLVDHIGAVWCSVGSESDIQLLRFRDGDWETINLGLDGNAQWRYYTALVEDSNGHVWISVVSDIGTSNPVYQNKVFKHDGTIPTLVYEHNGAGSFYKFLTLRMVDNSGGIWMTTSYGGIYGGVQYDGIIHYDGQYEYLIQETDGLPSNNVLDIIDNGDGSLFVATDKGLCRYRSDLIPVGVEKDEEPAAFSLIRNYPNPFNPSTTIQYTLEKACEPIIHIYSVTGQKVHTFSPGWLPPGQHSIVWDGTDEAGNPVSSGVYLCRMEAVEIVHSKGMTLVR